MGIEWVINQITVKDVDRRLIGVEMYKNISLEEMLKTEVDGILTNYKNGSIDYYYKNGEDEFRPDIIPIINGMPLSFIEVKKPNNREGILAERKRILERFKNKKF